MDKKKPPPPVSSARGRPSKRTTTEDDSVASFGAANEDASMELSASIELTPQFIEDQRRKAMELEERKRVYSQAGAPTSKASSSATHTTRAPPAMSQDAPQRSKRPPLIGAISVSGSESKHLSRRTLKSSSSAPSLDGTDEMDVSTTLPDEYNNDNAHSFRSYWKERFQRESEGTSTSAISLKHSGDEAIGRMVASLSPPPSTEFMLDDDTHIDMEMGEANAERFNSESVSSRAALRTSTGSSMTVSTLDASARCSASSCASVSMVSASVASGLRSESRSLHETLVSHRDATADDAVLPSQPSSNQADRGPSPPAVQNPSSTGRRRSVRRSLFSHVGLVEAQKVDDAEPVFYASVVTNTYFKRKRAILFGMGAILVILSLGLGVGLTLRRSHTESCQFEDEQCCVVFSQLPPAPDVVPLLCHCNQSLDTYISTLTEENITFANLVRDKLVSLDAYPNATTRMIPSENQSDSCSIFDQLYWASARMDLVNLDSEIIHKAPKHVLVSGSALLYMYFAMSGITWHEAENWLKTSFSCVFFGVDCIFIDTVSGLQLPANDLKNQIPSYLGKMKTLRELDLSHNHQITGTIPAELAESTALVSINLSHLPLSTSTIPSELGSLRRLEVLRLSASMLQGSLPPEIFYPPTLLTLDVSGNELNSTIPSSIGNASNLHVLKMNNNHLSGTLPSEIAQLSRLNILELASNNFEGTLPSFLSSMPLLELVNVINSGFTGDIPLDFCNSDLNREIVVTCSGRNITKLPCVRCVEQYPQILRNEL